MLTRNDDGRLVLTKDAWARLRRVQSDANRTVTWTSDREVWGVEEKWDFPKDSGRGLVEDCDGISLWKMRRLIADGFPPEVLLLTICKTETDEGHAVLCVTTDRGDFILDNRHRDVVSFDGLKDKGYRFLYRAKLGGKLTGDWDKIKSI